MNPEERHKNSEAYVFCAECGARLWSDDGIHDKMIPCPYKTLDGQCVTPEEDREHSSRA